MITLMGASGHVGGQIAKRLLAKGEKVRLITRDGSKLKSLAGRDGEICEGDGFDTGFLTKAFSGASAAFVLIPPNFEVDDFRAYQNRFGESIAKALVDSGVRHVVNLSSLGGELNEGTGPVTGLHDQEVRLNKLSLNVLHLRPAYFMENFLGNIPMIVARGMIGSALTSEKEMPIVASRDVGDVAAERLMKRDFTGSSVLAIYGPKASSMSEITREISRAIGKDLKYMTISPEDTEAGFRSMGLKQDLAHKYTELSLAMNQGLINESLKPSIRGSTTLGEFMQEIFAPAYQVASGRRQSPQAETRP